MKNQETTKETIIKNISKLKSSVPKEIARENTRAFLKNNAVDDEVVVEFKKKNSEMRTMIIKVGVPGKKGGVNKVERLDRSYLTVFDTQLKEHRTLNLRTLKTITIGGITLNVV